MSNVNFFDKTKQVFKKNKGFIVLLFLMFASRSSLADWYIVPTGSMQPTIVEGDRIFVNKMAYRLELPFTNISVMETGTPKRGDIVVFNSAAANNRLIKRLIGLPGDEIYMHNNHLVINGVALHYDQKSVHVVEHIGEVSHLVQFIGVSGARDNFSKVIVPEDHYLVLGDNRNNSADSRFIGFIPANELQGKALKVLLSLDPDDYFRPRTERIYTPLI